MLTVTLTLGCATERMVLSVARTLECTTVRTAREGVRWT